MERITTGTCSIDDKEIQYVTDALQSVMLSSGKYLHSFEKELASFYNKKYGILVNSGQTALELAFLAYVNKVGNGSFLVGVPTVTYMATIWSTLIYPGIIPVFFDVHKNTYNLDLDSIGYDQYNNKVPTKDLDLILPVDLFGKKCKVIKDRLNPNITIIEDACEAVCNPSCNYGDYIALSFYSSHILSCGSGGMILGNDPEDEKFIRSYIAHGRNHDGDFTARTSEFSDRFVFTKFGQSLRSDNITAAIGLAQFEKRNKIIGQRVVVSHKITSGLKKLEDSGLLNLPSLTENVFMFYPIVVNANGFNVLDLMKFLWSRNIDSRRMMPVLNQPAFKDIFRNLNPNLFPNSIKCENNGIILGCHQDLTDDQIEHVVQSIWDYFSEEV